MPRGDRYRVLEAEPPSAWVFGLALLHFWQTHFANRLTIHLDELHHDHGLGGILQLSPGRINRHLETLAGLGFVEVYRISPPYQVVLLRRDPAPLWDRLYATADDAG